MSKTFTTNSKNSTNTSSFSVFKKTTSRKTRSNSEENKFAQKNNSSASKLFPLWLDTSLKWSTKITDSSHRPVEPTTMWEFFQLSTEKNSRPQQVSLCIVTVTQLLISFPLNLMLPSRWCRSRKNLMSLFLILEVVTLRNKKWGKLLSCLSHTLNFTTRLVLTLPKECLCTGLQVQARQWWPKRLPTAQLQHLSGWLAHNSCKNIWEKVLEWCEMCSNWQNKTRLQLFSLTKLTQSLQSKNLLIQTFWCANWSWQRSSKGFDRIVESDGRFWAKCECQGDYVNQQTWHFGSCFAETWKTW